ncbi:MAG TPA: lipoyl domain-containing protein [Ramlibacter sp.]|uniref:lipoyl domain-containing protein n=1 Tax=Ramlibacter sp. TaxID=1917967 RepID=UPI002ED07560
MTGIALDDALWKDVEPGTEALVDQWLVKEGERVTAGQPVVRVVLVKATLEVPAPAAGVIEKIHVPAEQTFARGASLATLRTG